MLVGPISRSGVQALALLALVLPLPILAGAPIAAAPAASVVAPAQHAEVPAALTLEQAVAKVQQDTGGKVLRAGTRRFGDMIEYRIKVLTPNGHVRVVSVRARTARSSESRSKENH